MTLATTEVAIHPFKRVINHVVELIVAGCHVVQQSTQCVLLPLFEVICLQCVASFVCVVVKFNLYKCFEINNSGHFCVPILITLM